MTKKKVSPARSASKAATMFGCDRRAAAWISRSKRRTASGGMRRSRRMTLREFGQVEFQCG